MSAEKTFSGARTARHSSPQPPPAEPSERNQTVASPATLQFVARHQRKMLFALREKEIRRAQNEKSKEYFSVVVRACRAVAGLASLVLFKVGSSKVENIPHNNTSAFFREDCLGASPLGLVALRKAQSHIIPRRRKRKGSGFVKKLMVRSNFLDKCLNVLKIVALRQFFGFLYI